MQNYHKNSTSRRKMLFLLLLFIYIYFIINYDAIKLHFISHISLYSPQNGFSVSLEKTHVNLSIIDSAHMQHPHTNKIGSSWILASPRCDFTNSWLLELLVALGAYEWNFLAMRERARGGRLIGSSQTSRVCLQVSRISSNLGVSCTGRKRLVPGVRSTLYPASN